MAHDAMCARYGVGIGGDCICGDEIARLTAENERLRAALHRPQCPSTKAVEIVDGASETYPSRRGRCSVCDYEGPVNNSGNLWRHSSQAALAGKEPE